MNKFPNPPPDRRLSRPPDSQSDKKSNTKTSFRKQDLESEDKLSNINLMKIKYIEDIRKNLLNYRLLTDKKMFLNVNINSFNLNKCNLIVFGPSGTGKSSFIRTLYKALYGTGNLPQEAISKLIIKETTHNEGTLCFLRLNLKEETKDSSGIQICDTRGHILMNSDEKEQFKVIMEGNIKDNVKVVQEKNRSPLLLWEFWKRDSELFPKEIFDSKSQGISAMPHNIVFIFDGSSEYVIDPDDSWFYSDLVNISQARGYNNIHIVLTRVDILENEVRMKNKNMDDFEQQNLIHSMKDEKIEKVIDVLGVKRSNIHFIENYHNKIEDNNIEIDYHALKALNEMLNSAEQFLLMYYNRNSSCFAKCF